MFWKVFAGYLIVKGFMRVAFPEWDLGQRARFWRWVGAPNLAQTVVCMQRRHTQAIGLVAVSVGLLIWFVS